MKNDARRARGFICTPGTWRGVKPKKFVRSLFLPNLFFNLGVHDVYDSIIKKPGRRHVESDNIVCSVGPFYQAPTNKS